jgi:hypothetical protein
MPWPQVRCRFLAAEVELDLDHRVATRGDQIGHAYAAHELFLDRDATCPERLPDLRAQFHFAARMGRGGGRREQRVHGMLGAQHVASSDDGVSLVHIRADSVIFAGSQRYRLVDQTVAR